MEPLSHSLTEGLLRERLKVDTARAHRRLEASIDLLGERASRVRYVAFLRGLAAVHPAVESHLSRSPSYLEAVPDALERLRSHRLASDLWALGETAPSADPVPLGDLSEELGAAYVFEGATLGGRVLTRALPQKLQVPPAATRYVAGYEEQTAGRWRVFLECLSRAEPRVDVGRAVASASRIFELLRVRFEQELQSIS